ncbi:MAG: hypothetical protein ACYS99_21785 [Planctomycetota bacterium]|jgi:hypothetical protein
MQRICLMITVASLVLLAGDVLAGKPPASPVGEWSGQGKLKLKVKRGFKDRVSSSSGLNVTETNWTNVETAPVPGTRTTGTYTLDGKKYIWSYDANGKMTQEAALEDWIENYAASSGIIIEATVTISDVNTKAKAKDSKRKGRLLKVKGKVKFTVVATGDRNETRGGVYKLKYQFTPAP